jgi:hypothetical protein
MFAALWSKWRPEATTSQKKALKDADSNLKLVPDAIAGDSAADAAVALDLAAGVWFHELDLSVG